MFVGMDFGTSNSAVGMVDSKGVARIVSHDNAGLSERAHSDTLRSMVAFDRAHRNADGLPLPLVGQEGIAAYLNSGDECRLLQSFKSHLTSQLFTSATIFNRPYTLERLIAIVVERLRRGAEADGSAPVTQVVAGRPVRFVAEDGKDSDEYALKRLSEAFAQAGIAEIAFEFEPIAAAYYYERTLDRDETVLVADFGGGTSDFCLVRLGPSRAGMANPKDAIIGTNGIGIAGDTFDRRIVERGIAEFFGKNTTYHSNRKDLPVPDWIYGKFSRWHHIGFLGTGSTLRMLRDIQRHASHPERIEDLLTLIEYNLGYHLYRAVEQAKVALSQHEETTFVFDHAPVRVERRITRAEFESWIAPEREQIEACVDSLLESTGTTASQVDRVFMTGGSSLVPVVRAIFDRRFGADRVSAGGEFVSVASGLAYRAAELFGRR
ncbi:Hsp70 family protein [Magnetospirillum sulfuroxidans]|uniref:Hsp70 family protein n=1 Tax=Magnetospirillum sulfuroxidans TaxID=611300 RepID=A0ABS5IAI0_9PROT|nr:Hsp70 family protein [Magnetospirillum sulfuroxidans]MBR9971432.1 Hsp70 family protein [Magnetospirillum sulfuroxidans]